MPPLPDARAWSEIEQLNFEHEALGVFWSGHPIDSHAAPRREFGARTIAKLAPGEAVSDPLAEGPAQRPVPKSGDEVVVAGIISGVRPLKTRKGDRMGVFTLEDRQVGIEVVVYTEPFARFERLIENGGLVVVRGRLDKDDEESRLYASDMAPIESVRERLARELAITMVAIPPHGRQTFEALAALFEQHRGDKPVTLHLEILKGTHPLRVRAQVSPQIRVRPSPAFLAAVQKICGEGSVLLRSTGHIHRRPRSVVRRSLTVRGQIRHRAVNDHARGRASTGLSARCRPAADGEASTVTTRITCQTCLNSKNPIGVLLKEVEALSMLPATPEREAEIGGLQRRAESRGPNLPTPDAMAARAGRPPPSTPERSRIREPPVHRLRRDPRRSAVRR